MRLITCWLRYDEKQDVFKHNHIEFGHVPAVVTQPEPISEHQKKSWESARWAKQYSYLDNNNNVKAAKMEQEDDNVLENFESEIAKVYPAEAWHDSIHIIGGREALRKIRDACNKALQTGHGVTGLLEADGEGYDLHVVREDRSWNEWCELPYHYANRALTNNNDGFKWAKLHDLLKDLPSSYEEE